MMETHYFLIIYVYFGIIQPNEGITTTCSKQTSLNDELVLIYYCCRPFVETQTGCGCPLGSKTTKINYCEPCPPGFYGDNCLLPSSCGDNEICNPEVGCINIDAVDVTSGNILRKTTRPESKSGGADIWIGVITGSVIFVVILIVTGILLCKFRKSTKADRQIEPNNIQENPYVSAYDEIDENNLLENPVLITHTHIKPPPRIKNKNEHSNGGYLDPVSESKELVDIATGRKEPKNPRISGYLHPYQPILKHQCEVHKYLSTKDAVKSRKTPNKAENSISQKPSNVDDDDDYETKDGDDTKDGNGRDTDITTNGDYLDPVSYESNELVDIATGRKEPKNPRISGYLHPYQPILKHQCEVHKYLSTKDAVKSHKTPNKSENSVGQRPSDDDDDDDGGGDETKDDDGPDTHKTTSEGYLEPICNPSGKMFNIDVENI